jgi:hypothetical protein
VERGVGGKEKRFGMDTLMALIYSDPPFILSNFNILKHNSAFVTVD